MSREIKFRAWDGEVMEYMKIDITVPYYNEQLAKFFNDNFGCDMLQYTGIEDRQGKEIYEGDVVYVAGVGNCTIGWDNDYAGWMFSKGKRFEDYQGVLEDVEYIIGNIYEDPELVK